MYSDTRVTHEAHDDLDRQLVQALQLDGRAPFSRIADVLGVSDQTVARRYTRLRTAGTIRVLGLTDPVALGEVVWLVRVQCAPDAAVSVAEALARRPDTSWVSLLSGGTEIAAITRAASGEDSDALLLRKLPRTPRVVGVAAHCMLHEYFGGPEGLVSKSGMLTPRQIERLTHPVSPRPPGPPVALDEGDRRLLGVLARDGRAGLAELVAATGWSQSTVRRRLAELRSDGTLYFDVDYHPRLFGHGSTAVLWLSVPPAELAAAGEAVAAHPEVAFACATTGPHNLLAIVVCRDVRGLYDYLTTRVAALPGVRGMETSPTIRRIKGPGPLLLSPRGPARRGP
ncbi:Lrp/AsnC family transcriptional regulator [Streptomyces sparsogenes]|uniref:AsnC family transcriptional regulator n=1 Tax=Streptomyces sparsogenes DSM 40356 TaxID=1331668 RepID=A0A1R1SL47_9ACTN|nr:Lrp/AsnC family transcriptional regulator [Streptomyces sparsogenes]OMI38749.1 AsnC family transcriptional regulator [Streptomyces sparsogenes DSM 40356]